MLDYEAANPGQEISLFRSGIWRLYQQAGVIVPSPVGPVMTKIAELFYGLYKPAEIYQNSFNPAAAPYPLSCIPLASMRALINERVRAIERFLNQLATAIIDRHLNN